MNTIIYITYSIGHILHEYGRIVEFFFFFNEFHLDTFTAFNVISFLKGKILCFVYYVTFTLFFKESMGSIAVKQNI